MSAYCPNCANKIHGARAGQKFQCCNMQPPREVQLVKKRPRGWLA